MRISDWSSDVCSSDLPQAIASRAFARLLYGTHPYATQPTVASIEAITRDHLLAFHATHYVANHEVIGMIGNRKNVVKGQSLSVHVEFGGPRIIKKKKQRKQIEKYLLL